MAPKALYLEHYLDSLENLPVELERNLNLMRDLNSRAQDLMVTIDELGDEFFDSVKARKDAESRSSLLNDINSRFSTVKEYSDDKVQLSVQTYELVDKHIRRLDADLAKFEAEIRSRNSNVARSPEENVSNSKRGRKKGKGKEKAAKKKSTTSDEEASCTKSVGTKKKSKKGTPVTTVATGSKAANVSAVADDVASAPDGIDMPVDPNEPTYCLCNQVSYGEMIGCDNSDCPIEWFHFACVNLVTKPKGKWYCPRCSLSRKKK